MPSPAIKQATVATRAALLPAMHRLVPQRYTDATPYKVIDLSARWITHMQQPYDLGALRLPWLTGGRFARHASLRRRWHAGRVVRGGWDQAVKHFDDYHLTRVFTARFVDGQAWEDIPYIRKALSNIRQGQAAWGGRCTTEAQVWERCHHVDELYAVLQTDGFNPDARRFSYFLVNIGRDGRIVRNNDGKHRIILSRLLGLENMHARVLLRHRLWQHVRDRIRRGDELLARQHANHPDLADLVK